MLPRPSPSQAAAPRLVIERLSDRLATLLAAQVESGSLSPGDRLPTEQQLAQAHGVSRTVVREAVHQLTSRGLLISRQGSGVYVSKAPRNHALSFDAMVLESIDAVVRVREVRRALEGETAALAASRATRLQVAALRRALKAIDKSTAEGGDGVAEDLAFHRALTDAAGNPHFGRLLEFLEQYTKEAMRVTRRNDATRADFVEAVRIEHAAIVDAIAARDGDAAERAMRRHLSHVADALRARAGEASSSAAPGRRGAG